MAQSHQGEGQQEKEVVWTEHRVGQTAQQTAEGAGLELQQVHQVVGLGCLGKDRQANGKQEGCRNGKSPAPW
jgi:hypothetical protein